jgi:hypothetical protein
MSNLAAELFRESKKSEDDLPLRLALLREARDLYARGGFLNDALAMAEDLVKDFQVDALEEKIATLELAGHSPVAGPVYFVQVGEHALHLLEEARALDEYDKADRLIRMVEATAKNASNTSLATQARIQKNLVDKLRKEYARLKDALATLEKDPGHPQANLRVGHFQCFVKGSWDRGLPYLVKGNDPGLAALARQELDGSPKGKSLLDRADAWFELAKKTEGSNKFWFQKRAYVLFWQALGDLSEKEEAHAENQIKILIAQAPGLKGHWDSLNVGSALVMTYGNTEYLRLQPNQTLGTRRSFSGRLDIQTTFRTTRSNLTLEAFPGAGITLIFGSKKGEVRIQFPGNTERVSRNWPLFTGQWYSLRWLISEQGMMVRINDQLVFAEGKKNFNLSSKRPVKIIAGSSGVDVQSLNVTSPK